MTKEHFMNIERTMSGVRRYVEINGKHDEELTIEQVRILYWLKEVSFIVNLSTELSEEFCMEFQIVDDILQIKNHHTGQDFFERVGELGWSEEDIHYVKNSSEAKEDNHLQKMQEEVKDYLLNAADNEDLEDFLGYPISADVLDCLESNIEDVLSQMPEEELRKFHEKYSVYCVEDNTVTVYEAHNFPIWNIVTKNSECDGCDILRVEGDRDLVVDYMKKLAFEWTYNEDVSPESISFGEPNEDGAYGVVLQYSTYHVEIVATKEQEPMLLAPIRQFTQYDDNACVTTLPQYNEVTVERMSQDIMEQLKKRKNKTGYGEPQAFVELPNDRTLEVTHEEYGLSENDQYYSFRVNCSEEEFENETYQETNGILDTAFSRVLDSTICKAYVKWAYLVAKKK